MRQSHPVICLLGLLVFSVSLASAQRLEKLPAAFTVAVGEFVMHQEIDTELLLLRMGYFRSDWYHDEETDYDAICFTNQKRTEFLTLYVQNGEPYTCIGEIRVNQTAPRNNCGELTSPHFITDKEIELGITKDAFLKKLGPPTIEVKAGNKSIYRYVFNPENYDYRSLPDHYIGTDYFGYYTFEQDVLVQFEFGFEMP